jgi:hypothetical protein
MYDQAEAGDLYITENEDWNYVEKLVLWLQYLVYAHVKWSSSA